MDSQKLNHIILLALFVVSICNAVQISNAQSLCNMSAADLLECKPSVSPPNPSPPTSACCSALKHADLQCFCSYKKSKLLPSLGIDPNLAMELPTKCKLPHPANC